MTSEVVSRDGYIKRPQRSFWVPVLVLAASELALACPICFRVEENATTDGVQAAVLVLVGVTTVVLGAFARFIVGFVKRESRHTGDPEA
jgi:heme/copper-type cytochrome/quinol oxidase subunit 2